MNERMLTTTERSKVVRWNSGEREREREEEEKKKSWNAGRGVQVCDF